MKSLFLKFFVVPVIALLFGPLYTKAAKSERKSAWSTRAPLLAPKSEVANVVEVFDPKTNAWTTKKPMPTKRGGVNGIAANGCLHVFGGEGNDAHPKGLFVEHEYYNPVTDTWHSLDPMPIPVHGVTGAAFIDGWIHLPGGGTERGGSSGSTLHQVYRAAMTCR